MTGPYRSAATPDPSESPDWKPMQAWIQANRQSLDTELPPKNGWNALNRQLPVSTPVRSLRTGWRAVAAAILIGGASMFVIEQTNPGAISGNLTNLLERPAPEGSLPVNIAKIESHSQAQIEKIQNEIKALGGYDSSIASSYKKQEAAIISQIESLRAQVEQNRSASYTVESQWEHLRGEQIACLQQWKKALEGRVPGPSNAR